MGANEKAAATYHPGDGPTPRAAADVLREHYATQRTIFPDPPIPSCTCGWTEGMNRRDFPQHQADMLAAAGLLAKTPCCAPSAETIDGHWLVEHHTHHTCGAGGPEGHEPGCGLVPLVDLVGLSGWDSLVAHVHAEFSAEHDREVAASALRDAAEALNYGEGATLRSRLDGTREFLIDPGLTVSVATHQWLRARADLIAAGEEP